MAFNRDLSQLANFLEVNSEGTFVNIIPSTSETNLGIRVISLRKANQREEKRYEKDIVPNE
jgi:uncharacterized DUF497 family protein